MDEKTRSEIMHEIGFIEGLVIGSGEFNNNRDMILSALEHMAELLGLKVGA